MEAGSVCGTRSKWAIDLKTADYGQTLKTYRDQCCIDCPPQAKFFEMPPKKDVPFVRPTPKIQSKAMPERPTWEKHGINRPPPPVFNVDSCLPVYFFFEHISPEEWPLQLCFHQQLHVRFHSCCARSQDAHGEACSSQSSNPWEPQAAWLAAAQMAQIAAQDLMAAEAAKRTALNAARAARRSLAEMGKLKMDRIL